MIITCPKCFSADDVTYVNAPDAGFLYTCTNAKKHPSGQAYEWVADPKDPTIIYGSSEDGVTTELMDPFEQIIRKLPPAWIEYGVLEYELRLQYPQLFGSHVREAGHRILAPTQSTASSSRFAIALSRLKREGRLGLRWKKGTGAWSYNNPASFWAMEPAELGIPTITWEQYAAQHGRSAEWTDADRATVAELAGK
jgi:hypothetical protein